MSDTFENNTILIIDDEDDFRFLLKEKLESFGFNIIEAEKGNQGVIQALRQSPDIILLDLNLPDMRGEQVWKELQQEPDLKEIPVIILTAKMRAEDHFFGDRIPKKDFITKPYDIQELIDRIKTKIDRANKK